jgi:ribulose-5-phosphate 4-epimerase/fuculose-1-phosphate aldolase
MDNLFQPYENQLIAGGLCKPGDALMGFYDASLIWNRRDPLIPLFEKLFAELNINSILFARPAAPYRTIFDFLTARFSHRIIPQDCETRTFIHDLPIIRSLNTQDMVMQLQQRKSVIISGQGVVSYGTVSLEQAIVSFSSACFACFVKFFGDYLSRLRSGRITDTDHRAFGEVRESLDPPPDAGRALMSGPFQFERQVHTAMAEAGRRVVQQRLVDSFFGNLSYLLENTLYISQTGSRLDTLQDCIDPVPLDASSCAGITASSELAAHLSITAHTGCRAILHGHPKFAVILSMDCDRSACRHEGECHRRCPYEREVCGIPVVSGEVGKGPYGLWKTVPQAIRQRPGVIVYGHGLFATGDTDFNVPFRQLIRIENQCRQEYFDRVKTLMN